MIKIKTASEIEDMRRAGRMLAEVLQFLKPLVVSGVSTQHLNDEAQKKLKTLGGEPAFLNYQKFPAVLCVSVNEEVVHGIPNPNKIIKSGDIVGLDFGVRVNKMCTDGAITVIAGGALDAQSTKLVQVTEQALTIGIKKAVAGNKIGDISEAIQTHLEKSGLGVVRALVGHGIGSSLHEEPNVPNFGRSGSGPELKAGMTLAIEPMATLGDYTVQIADDGWTVLTKDSSLSAHFEHTILITTAEPEILTKNYKNS